MAPPVCPANATGTVCFFQNRFIPRAILQKLLRIAYYLTFISVKYDCLVNLKWKNTMVEVFNKNSGVGIH